MESSGVQNTAHSILEKLCCEKVFGNIKKKKKSL